MPCVVEVAVGRDVIILFCEGGMFLRGVHVCVCRFLSVSLGCGHVRKRDYCRQRLEFGYRRSCVRFFQP